MILSDNRLSVYCLGLVLGIIAQALPAETSSSPSPQVLAPGYHELQFEAPAPGDYQLPAMGQATGGRVLDAQGNRLELSELFADHAVLLAFIYRNCHDVNGCPLTELVLRQVQRRLAEETEFARHLRILSLSFDPRRDTPAALKPVQKSVASTTNPQWLYLTTDDKQSLAPILQNYQQSVIREVDADGNETGILSHILRVFLIDPQGLIRNIYSASFLHADTLINDVKTVLLEHPEFNREPGDGATTMSLPRAGDDKSGYETSSYTTQSLALTQRSGNTIDLIAHAGKPRTGLSAVPTPPDNPLQTERVELGRRLFFDRRLSLNNTISCAMCHIPEQGFASNELATAVGFEGRTVRRNAPTLLNTAYLERLFHDGREFSLEDQIWGPLLAANEMANPSPGYILKKLQAIAGYRNAFEQIFGSGGDTRSLTMRNLGLALASYQRTLIAADTPFDRWYYGKETTLLSDAAQRGFELFSGKAGCTTCHTIGPQQALFTDQQMHNTGIGYARSMAPQSVSVKVQLAPGLFVDVDRASYEAAAEPVPADLGLYEITQDPADRWKFRTPMLRNVALTAPYMHDGSIATLADVVSFYNAGGIANEVLDPAIKPLALSAREQADIVAFLQSLTSPEVEALVFDAFAAPIGDSGSAW